MEHDPFQEAEELACMAADALGEGRQAQARKALADAMKLDPTNPYANILLSGLAKAEDPARLQHARDALEGAATRLHHFAIQRPDQRHTLAHADQALADRVADWEGKARRKRRKAAHYKGGTDAKAIRAHERDQPFHDQWLELPMRDYLRALFQLGKVLAEAGRPAEAAIHFRELLTQSPVDRFGAAPWLVAALVRIGLFAEAEQWIEIYEEHDAATGHGDWTPLARGLLEISRGDREAAVEALATALDVEGPNPYAKLMRGEAPPTGGSHMLSDDEVAPVNLWRAFHPTVASAAVYGETMREVAE